MLPPPFFQKFIQGYYRSVGRELSTKGFGDLFIFSKMEKVFTFTPPVLRKMH
jgi:hypothetical protein